MIESRIHNVSEMNWDRSQSSGKYHSSEQRYNIYELNNLNFEPEKFQRINQQILGVGCLIDHSLLYLEKENPDSCLLSDLSPTLAQRVENVTGKVLGEKEPFYEELAVGHATAFLIGKKRALTAAHVVCRPDSDELDIERVRSLRLVFGFQMKDAQECNKYFERKNVYEIKKVKSHVYKKSQGIREDWAVLKLDRTVEDHTALQLNFNYRARKADKVYTLGYPLGQAMKFTGNGEIMNTANDKMFQVNLDTYVGNSGSPIFLEKTGEVIGILCSGQDDFVFNDDYRGTGLTRVKMKSNITALEIGRRGYEWCQKIRTLNSLNESSL